MLLACINSTPPPCPHVLPQVRMCAEDPAHNYRPCTGAPPALSSLWRVMLLGVFACMSACAPAAPLLPTRVCCALLHMQASWAWWPGPRRLRRASTPGWRQAWRCQVNTGCRFWQWRLQMTVNMCPSTQLLHSLPSTIALCSLLRLAAGQADGARPRGPPRRHQQAAGGAGRDAGGRAQQCCAVE